jgi:hypothetical protein
MTLVLTLSKGGDGNTETAEWSFPSYKRPDQSSDGSKITARATTDAEGSVIPVVHRRRGDVGEWKRGAVAVVLWAICEEETSARE